MPRPFGPYQLLRRIAVGGMAEVYVALAKGVSGFEKLVALKLIHAAHSEDDAFVRMLVDEAKLSVLLGHSNIAQTFDLGSVEGRFYIVMEYVDGADVSQLLDRVIAKKALLPVEAALFIMTRVCQALDYAHRKVDPSGASLGVIHRDVSPQNVLLSRDGDVKLTDFGIAKAALRVGETEVGVIKGKYCYMSPEQAWADPIDHRSDIFSAGAVLYELLTGRMLFSPDDNIPALLERVRKAEIDPPSTLRPEVPPELDAIVLRALARKARDRFESAGDFAAELERQLWLRDRTWGAAKLRKLMDEYVPTGIMETPTADRTREVATKMEGHHGTMRSQEFMPETSTSMLFRTSGDSFERVRDSDSPDRLAQRSGPSTMRNVVERGVRQSTDPRVERPLAQKPDDDDEEEATTLLLQDRSLRARARGTHGELRRRIDHRRHFGRAREAARRDDLARRRAASEARAPARGRERHHPDDVVPPAEAAVGPAALRGPPAPGGRRNSPAGLVALGEHAPLRSEARDRSRAARARGHRPRRDARPQIATMLRGAGRRRTPRCR